MCCGVGKGVGGSWVRHDEEAQLMRLRKLLAIKEIGCIWYMICYSCQTRQCLLRFVCFTAHEILSVLKKKTGSIFFPSIGGPFSERWNIARNTFSIPLGSQGYCDISENGVPLMYTLEGVSSIANFITAYEESQ